MSNNNALAAGSLPVWPSETSLLSSMLTVLAPTAATGQLPGRQLRNFSRALTPPSPIGRRPESLRLDFFQAIIRIELPDGLVKVFQVLKQLPGMKLDVFDLAYQFSATFCECGN